MQRLFTTIGGPIFGKELIETARRKRYFVNRMLYAAALLIVVSLVWENASYLRHGGTTIREMAQFARQVFLAVSMVEYGAIWFFVPVFVCGLVAAEREAQTLDLLLTSQLSDREIVIGKLCSRLAIVVQILLSTLPVICLVGIFGGIEASSVWRTLMSNLLAILFAGAFSIYFSSTSRSPVGALVRTYWWLAVLLIGLPAFTVLLLETFGAVPSSRLAILFFGQALFNPIATVIVIVSPFEDQLLQNQIGRWYYAAMYIIPTLVSVGLLWRAVARLRVDPSQLLLSRLGSWLLHRFAPSVVRQRARRVTLRANRAERWLGMATIVNPVWLRARLARVYDREGYVGRIQWMGWAAAVAFIVLLVLFNPRELGHDDPAFGVLIPTWFALGLLTTIFAASSLVNDRRRGFFDLVLVTTLEPREIIDGTWLAVWQHVRNTWWLAVVFTGLFALTGSIVPRMALVSLISGTLFCATIISCGVMTSLAATRLPQSLVPTFMLPLVTTAGTGLLIAFCRQWSGPIALTLATAFLFGAILWLRRSVSPAAIGATFIAVHLALVFAATAWAFDGRNEALPLGLCNPGPMIIGVLGERHDLGNLFCWRRNGKPPLDTTFYVLAYWLAMVVNIVWARHWTLKNFDRMTGRVGPHHETARTTTPRSDPIRREQALETVA
jgi:ABC-type transport system involved in multi-copper enzyme maturation permease subunit